MSAEMADGRQGDLAPVALLDPSQSEEGFLDSDILRQRLLAVDPLSIVTGAWRGVHHAKSRVLGGESQHMPDRVFVPLNGHKHLLLVSDPDPETGVKASEAPVTWFKPGLGEIGDVGSALNLHVAHAGQHPERRTVTEATPGMSHTGKTVALATLSGRQVEAMAADSLQLMKIVTEGAPTDIYATSLGTRLAMAMAELDLAANEGRQGGITRLRLIASAAIASKIEGSENFRPPDVDEDEYRQDLSKRFQRHIPGDFVRMVRRHPADMLACWPTLAAHVLAHPLKAHSRLRTMMRDYANVKEGTDWSSLKYVVERVPVDVLGGEHDPLIQEQIPQWQALGRMYPGRVRLTVLEDLGHLMSAAAANTVTELDRQNDGTSFGLALAA